MAIEAAKQMADGHGIIAGYTIEDVTFSSPLTILSGSQATETQLHLRPLGDLTTKDSYSEFTIYVSSGDQWSETCRGRIHVESEAEAPEVDIGTEARAQSTKNAREYEEGLLRCNEALTKDRLYEYLQHIGLAYGPAFQALEQLSYARDGVACGKINSFQWSHQETANHFQPHVIHPTTLDAIFQLMLVSLSKGTKDDIPTVMATRIGKLWVAGRGFSHPSTCRVKAHARAAFTGRRKANGRVFVLDETTNETLVSFEDAEMTTVATRESGTPAQNPMKRLCYRLDWKPDLDLLSRAQLRDYCESARPNRTSDAEFYEDLDYILLFFISDALDALREFDVRGMESHLRQYIKWAKFQLDQFHTGALPHLSSKQPIWIRLLQDARHREYLIKQVESTEQGKFFLRTARHLVPMLKGQLDPLAFMFQDDAIPEFYKEVNQNVICYEPFNQYIGAMCHRDPGMKVLEIGAGTGATTDFVLDALSSHEEGLVRVLDCSQYDYTDISPAFFESAAARYERNKGRMSFKVLNIETDPSKQGFELGSYDLIIAASVSNRGLGKSAKLIIRALGSSCYQKSRGNDA